MDLFLHPENQTILWQTIQLSESWPAFQKQRPVAEWFKKTMEEAYLTYSPFYDNKPMTTEELRVLNRRVVLVMMQEMHESTRQPTTATATATTTATTRRAQGTAFQRAPPPPIDFTADDNGNSQRLDSNRLDELVKSQMAQRQAELEQFHPSPNEGYGTPSSTSYASY